MVVVAFCCGIFILVITIVTTGDHEFAVCPRHTAKNRKHMAKTSPTVADGKAPTAATGTAKPLFAVCIYRRTAKKKREDAVRASGRRRRLFAMCLHRGHTVNFQTSPCVLGSGTRQISKFRRVPSLRRMTNYGQFAVCMF